MLKERILSMKTIIWNEKAREFIKSLDNKTKKEIGTLLIMLQYGAVLQEPQSKKMTIIHHNAYELRIRDRFGSFRIIYVLNLKEKIFIPHAFMKKSQKTSQKEINTSINSLKELLYENQ